MKHLKLTLLLAGIISLLPGNHSQAQYTVTGTTAGGGFIITGTGTNLPPLGPGAPLSGAGFDRVTIQPGAVVPSTSTAVQFQTTHDSVTNLGTINFNSIGFYFGGTGGSNTGDRATNAGTLTSNGNGGAFGFWFMAANGSNTGNTILNSGSLGTGGASNLIDISASAGNSGNLFTNSGIITTNLAGGSTVFQISAGTGDNTGNVVLNSGTVEDGNGSTVYLLYANSGNNTGNSVTNSGLIQSTGNINPITIDAISGSNTGNTAINSGTINMGGNSTAILLSAAATNSGNTVMNSALISTNGGSGSDIILLTAGNGNTGNTVSNSGDIEMGGGLSAIHLVASGGNNGSNFVTNSGSMNIGSLGNGVGIYLEADAGNNSSNTVVNSGNIAGAGGYEAVDFYGNTGNIGNTVVNSGIMNTGSNSVAAIYLYANNGDNSGNRVTNSGSIIQPYTSYTSIVFFSNNGGNTGNVVTNSGNMVDSLSGTGIEFDANSGTNNSANRVVNTGNISMGAGGTGIYFRAGGSNIGNTVTNSGNISVGPGGTGISFFPNGGADHGNSIFNTGYINAAGATGVQLNLSDTSTVANWGAISAVSGTAVLISGSGNVVKLNGHSSTTGKISLSGPANSNVVNLNFTGLTPAAINALKPLLLAQGVNSGADASNVTFTLRGVTYNIDPAVVNFRMSSYQLQAVTPNQAAIGASLDGITYNPAPGTPLFLLFNAIDQGGSVPAALDALSPGKFAVLGDLAIKGADFTVQTIDARLNNIRIGSESIDTGGIGGATVAGLAKDDGHDGKTSRDIQQTTAPTPDRWGFFATGNGLFFRGNRNDKSNTAGTLAGVDARAGDHAVLGAMFAYDNSSVELDNFGSHASIESYTGGAYGSFFNGGFYLNGLAAYTRNVYRTTRNVTLGGFGISSNGSPNGNQATVNIDGGYDWNATDRLAVGPLLGVQYVHLGIDGFSESGAPVASLAVNSQDINSLQSRLGVHASYRLLTTPASSFALDLHAAWQHEYLNGSRAIGATFNGSGLAPFAVQTASPLRDAAVVGVGVNATFHDRLTLFMDYNLELWRANYFEQTINGGARISF